MNINFDNWDEFNDFENDNILLILYDTGINRINIKRSLLFNTGYIKNIKNGIYTIKLNQFIDNGEKRNGGKYKFKYIEKKENYILFSLDIKNVYKLFIINIKEIKKNKEKFEYIINEIIERKIGVLFTFNIKMLNKKYYLI